MTYWFVTSDHLWVWYLFLPPILNAAADWGKYRLLPSGRLYTMFLISDIGNDSISCPLNTVSACFSSVVVSPLVLNASSPLGPENISDYSMVSCSCHQTVFNIRLSSQVSLSLFCLVLSLSTHDLSSTSLLWTGISWVRKSAWCSVVPWWANPANTSLIWPWCLSCCSWALTPWLSRSRSSRQPLLPHKGWKRCISRAHVTHGDVFPSPGLYCIDRCPHLLLVVSCFSPSVAPW